MKRSFFSIFFRYFVQFLLLIIIFAVSLALIYSKIEGTLEQSAYESNRAILKQAATVSDGYVDSVRSLATQLLSESKIENIMRLNKNTDGMLSYYLLEARNTIRNFCMINGSDLISSIYIYYDDIGVVVTDKTVYMNPELYFSIYLQNSYESYDAWHGEMCTYHHMDFKPNVQIYNDSIFENVIMYRQSIPLYAAEGYSKGTLCIMLKEKTLNSLLKELNIDDGWYYVVDGSTQELLYSSSALTNEQLAVYGSNNTYNGNKMVLSAAESENGWEFISVLPYEVVTQPLAPVIRVIMTAFTACIIISVFIAALASYRNSAPVVRIISRLKEDDAPSASGSAAMAGHFSFIENSITAINDQNRRLDIRHRQNLEMLKTYFYERLINDRFERDTELFDLMLEIGIPSGAAGYVCAFVQYDFEYAENESAEEQEDELLKLLNIAAADYESDLEVFGYPAGGGKCLLLFCIKLKSDDSHPRDIIHDMCETMQQISTYGLFFACGSCVSDPRELHISIAGANSVLASTAFKSEFGGIIWTDDETELLGVYKYGQERSAHLTQLIKSGNYEKCSEYLAGVLSENLDGRALSQEMISQLMHEIGGTVIGIAQSMGEEGEPIVRTIVENMPSTHHFDTAHCAEILYSAIKSICGNIAKVQNGRKKQLAEDICGYITQNYGNQLLSLNLIADEFKMSKSYLSTFFKEQTGEHLSHYIETVRINHACELLRKGDLNIDAIAAECGYNSAISFRRAFKRLKDINPSELKETNGQKGVQ